MRWRLQKARFILHNLKLLSDGSYIATCFILIIHIIHELLHYKVMTLTEQILEQARCGKDDKRLVEISVEEIFTNIAS